MQCRIEIREATEADKFSILNLMVENYRVAESGGLKADSLKCLWHIDNCRQHGFEVVAEADGRIVGTFLGFVEEQWWSRDQRAASLFSFVLPEFRPTHAGLKLYRAFRKWARERGMKMRLGTISGVEIERMEKLFSRMGLTKMGTIYIEV